MSTDIIPRRNQNANRDMTEFIKQREARAIAIFYNSAELNDPEGRQLNRPRRFTSASARTALTFGRTTQISLTAQTELASTIAQFAIVRNPILYRIITLNTAPQRELPPITAGLVLWIDAKNPSSFVTGSNRTLASLTYPTVTSIRDSFSSNLGSSNAPGYSNPIYVDSVSSNFMTTIGKSFTVTNQPALWFRGYGDGHPSDSHLWSINKIGKPLTLFYVAVAADAGGGGVFLSKQDQDSYLCYGWAYDTMNLGNIDLDFRAKGYSSYRSPVLMTYADRVDGVTKQGLMRFNGVQRGIRNVGNQTLNNGFNNFNTFRTGRNNGEMASMLLHEVLLFETLMTDAEITQVETYLKNRWNLNMAP